MERQHSQLGVILILAAVVAALFVAGCAEMGSANTTSLLTATGFRARTPQTPQQQQIYTVLPSYQVQRATVKGKGVFYVYKDEKAGIEASIASVGREQEYQRYQQLAVQQQIAQKLLHGSGNGPCSRMGLVRSMGSASFLVVNA